MLNGFILEINIKKEKLLKTLYKLLTINVFLIGLFVVGLSFGLIQPLYLSDVSKLTYVISGIMFVNISLSLFNVYKKSISVYYAHEKERYIEKYLSYVSTKLPYIGLCGTLIGLIGLIDAIQLAGSGDITAQILGIIVIMKSSMKTMFNPTLMGIVGYLWTSLLIFIDTGEE